MQSLQTPRLRLDPLRVLDVPALVAHWVEPGVRRYLWDGDVVSEEQVRGIVERSAKLFDEHGVGLWALREPGSRRLIGCAGFWFFHEPPELELIYSLSEAYWRRGLGRECARELLRHAFDDLGWPLVQASTDTPNAASLALLRALRMSPAGERPGAFGSIEVFRITREEWSRPRTGASPSVSES